MLFGKKKRRIHNILIVEDEPLVAFDTEHLLSDEGFEIVATVDTVADAVSLIAQGAAIDLVLVDVALSDGSGIEVARAAHEHGVSALFVTGDCPVDAREFAAGCLAKPYNPRELLAAIDAIGAVVEGEKPKKLPGNLSLFRPAA
tara:strand:- start:85 stop:516 length:432 start_codon:yes stop_codon:yes gene_type:complete